jgi:hypothetical protein
LGSKFEEEKSAETINSSTVLNEISTSDDSKIPKFEDFEKFEKNNLINYQILEGHQYEIVPNKSTERGANNYLYI